MLLVLLVLLVLFCACEILSKKKKKFKTVLITSNILLLSESVAFAQNWAILQTRMDHIKKNFDYFQIQKWMLQTVRAEKLNEKNGIIFHFLKVRNESFQVHTCKLL